MARLIVQIPCYNEESTIGITLSSLPRTVPGVESVEWLIINDGSTDRTVEVARAHGVDHVVNLNHHQGLAKAFMAGLEACLRAGADIIVSTDADNQYCAEYIPRLIEPILLGKAEIVIGARPIREIKHFSPLKKGLQRLGSWVVRLASSTSIQDATSGFRAISREAAIRLNLFSAYTYTLEMIIQAGQLGIPITSVPIRTNEELRPSRLITGTHSYILKQMFTILRIFMIYKPAQFFLIVGSIFAAFGLVLDVRWLVLFLGGTPRTHVPSLIIASLLTLTGVQLWIFGLVAELMAVNRRILENILLRVRRSELGSPEKKRPS
jgi:glycosyltransferase involved in cell wall biosynthesis